MAVLDLHLTPVQWDLGDDWRHRAWLLGAYRVCLDGRWMRDPTVRDGDCRCLLRMEAEEVVMMAQKVVMKGKL